MSKTLISRVASALSFAHLAGLGRAAAETPPDDEDKNKPAAEDDPKKKRDDESAEEYAARMEAMPEDEDKDDKEKASAAVATARAEGVAEGRRMERERATVVFSSAAAANNIPLAAELTFGSDMDAERIVGVLAKAGPSAESVKATAAAVASATRAARNPNVGPGAVGQESTTKHATATSWGAAFAKANPSRKRPN